MSLFYRVVRRFAHSVAPRSIVFRHHIMHGPIALFRVEVPSYCHKVFAPRVDRLLAFVCSFLQTVLFAHTCPQVGVVNVQESYHLPRLP